MHDKVLQQRVNILNTWKALVNSVRKWVAYWKKKVGKGKIDNLERKRNTNSL